MNALLPFKIGREKLWFSWILVSNLQWLLEPFRSDPSKWLSVNKIVIYHSCTPLSSFLKHFFSA